VKTDEQSATKYPKQRKHLQNKLKRAHPLNRYPQKDFFCKLIAESTRFRSTLFFIVGASHPTKT